jgi:hypothetical protein
MNVYSDFTIPTIERHVTIFLIQKIYTYVNLHPLILFSHNIYTFHLLTYSVPLPFAYVSSRKNDHVTYRKLIREYCGVFTPCNNCNIETRSRDYATVYEAVFSPCRAEPSRHESRIASHRRTSFVARQQL